MGGSADRSVRIELDRHLGEEVIDLKLKIGDMFSKAFIRYRFRALRPRYQSPAASRIANDTVAIRIAGLADGRIDESIPARSGSGAGILGTSDWDTVNFCC